MNEIKRKVIHLENQLISAYREKEAMTLDGEWESAVMKDVRRSRLLVAVSPPGMGLFSQWVWRFAPVAGALIVLFTFLLFHLDVISEFEMATLLMNDPVEFSLVQSFLI
ncbi:MAG: hypothetical protein JXD19_07490 [Deltaproteobacteria bacterium]|nr:hypothetical protein [Deltaproteobacteria bacterium]